LIQLYSSLIPDCKVVNAPSSCYCL